jgi:hypothetical protein
MPATKQKQEAPEMRFRVLATEHRHDDHKIYVQGRILRDNRRLDLAFPNKFENLDLPEGEEDEVALEQITDKLVDVLDIPRHMARNIAKAAGLKPAEEVTEEDEEGLDQGVVVNAQEKARRARAENMARRQVDVEEDPENDEESDAPGAKASDTNAPPPRATARKAKAEEEDDRGVDLTDDFEGAKDKGLSVFKQGKSYQVFKGKKAIDDATFTKKGDVDSFIGEQ